MGPFGLDLAIEWAAAEGWNPGLFDAGPFLVADPDGFLVGMRGDEPVATISAVAYGSSFGFVGFYIVRPDRRGQGFGLKIWHAAMQRLAGRNVGLDGVPAQQANYERSGFVLAHRNARYEGVGPSTASSAGFLGTEGIVPLSALPFEEVVDYDRRFFAAVRTGFLARWISQPQCIALGLVHDGRLAGYGVLRTCRVGQKMGPLFADTPEGAEALFCALRGRVAEGVPLFLDVPDCNPQAVALVTRHQMTPVLSTARMYTGPAPDVSWNRTYGVTSFELG
jgi:GNAT superfamily N-acetyltransferase